MIDLKSEEAHMQLVEHVEDEDDCFEAIDKLIAQGINAGDIKKLQDAAIYTCNGLMMQTKKSLTGIKGLSEAKVDKICEAAEKIIRRSVVKITTGSPALDELLAGGIETSSTREAFGEFRSGKTQLAHTLCVSTQLPLSMHGGNGKVAYIDTEETFVPDRIVPIAELFGFGSVAVLENIIQSLAQMLSPMSKVAQEFNVAVCVTNQVIADPGGRLFILDPTKFAGGDVLAHARQPTVQLFSKGKGVERVCKVFDTRRVSESEAFDSRTWALSHFQLPSFDHNLRAGNPNFLFAASLGKIAFGDDWRIIPLCHYSSHHLSVNSVKSLVILIGASLPTTIFDVVKGSFEFFIPLPRIYNPTGTLVSCRNCVHTLQTERFLYVLGNGTNKFASFNMGLKRWEDEIEFVSTDAARKVLFSMAGMYEDMLVLVGVERKFSKHSLISIWKSSVDSEGIPSKNCTHISDMPGYYIEYFQVENVHLEDAARMVDEYFCLYDKPHLCDYSLKTEAWSYTTNKDNRPQRSYCLTVSSPRVIEEDLASVSRVELGT